MEIYIGGKITSKTFIGVQKNLKRFYEMEKKLRSLGHKVFNPAAKYPQGKSWEWYMVRILVYFIESRPVCFFLKGWQKSNGARVEHEMAKFLGLTIIYEDDRDKKWVKRFF